MEEPTQADIDLMVQMTASAQNRDRDQRLFSALVEALDALDFPGPGTETLTSDAGASGCMGGDSGHGGEAWFTLQSNGADLNVTTKYNGRETTDRNLDEVCIHVGGDWEQIDLIYAMVKALAAMTRKVFPLPGEG